MKYAIISDIHGNLSALDAVLQDAQCRGVDGYIFVGDYCLSNPYPDDCITRIRSLDNTYVIRGNEERYLENLVGKDQSTWTDGQMQISYFCYRKVSKENLNYLLDLPIKIDTVIEGVPIHVAHSSESFINNCEHREWSTAKVAERYKGEVVSLEAFRKGMHNYLNNDKDFKRVFDSLSDGIYIFGHSHIQWCYTSEDNKKILINPGSCGLSLDCITDGIPYTVLDIADKDNVQIEEVRVPIDIERHINTLIQSDQFAEANVWSKVIIKELRTCREHLYFFLQFTEDYASRIGDERRPFSVETWEKAYELWERKL